MAKGESESRPSDPIRPGHYFNDTDFEVQVVLAHWQAMSDGKLTHRKCSAIEYIARSGRKAGADEAEDLRKAAEFLLREATWLETMAGRPFERSA